MHAGIAAVDNDSRQTDAPTTTPTIKAAAATANALWMSARVYGSYEAGIRPRRMVRKSPAATSTPGTRKVYGQCYLMPAFPTLGRWAGFCLIERSGNVRLQLRCPERT